MMMVIKTRDTEVTEGQCEHVKHRLALALSVLHARDATVRMSVDGGREAVSTSAASCGSGGRLSKSPLVTPQIVRNGRSIAPRCNRTSRNWAT